MAVSPYFSAMFNQTLGVYNAIFADFDQRINQRQMHDHRPFTHFSGFGYFSQRVISQRAVVRQVISLFQTICVEPRPIDSDQP